MPKAKKLKVAKTQEEIDAGELPICVWKYTINNYTEADVSFVMRLVDATEVKRHVCGKEVGDKGTPHLQGAISLVCGKRYTPMKKLFPTAHLEKAIMVKDFSYELKGDVIVNVNNDQRTTGNKEANLVTYVENVKSGMNETNLLVIDPENALRYSSTLVKLLDEEGRKTRENIEVEVWYGGPGISKSHRALEMFPGAFRFDAYGSKFWDGHTDQKVLILNEFACGFNINECKKILDKQPLWLNVKFGGA
ncbi:hypothetical protein T492DRAFT_876011 [Pavlovales sp. CCMP2436]|nr:hypothetical protein T492DRAFT_876011 [Pavlovales sp. CCMP2436]